jgi:SAM-dependent methyltransferase
VSEWSWEVAERDHFLQNATSEEKIRLLGQYVRLGPDVRVLDTACGKGGPAVVLASTFGCRIVGVEVREAFTAAARERVASAGLDELVEIHTGDAKEFPVDPESYDVALCLGASFVWGAIADASAALLPAVKHGGFVAIGEPYWRSPPPHGVDDLGWVDLAGTARRFTDTGVAITGLIAASEDDYDRYESLHWRALEEWLAEHPDAEIRAPHERRRADQLAWRRTSLGWAIFVGRKS